MRVTDTTRVLDAEGDVHLSRLYGRETLCGESKVGWPVAHGQTVTCQTCADVYVGMVVRQVLKFIGLGKAAIARAAA